MKVAVMVQGLFRTLPECWPRWAAYFNAYSPDIYYLCHERERLEESRAILKSPLVEFQEDLPQDEKNYASNLGLGNPNLQNYLRQLADLQMLGRMIANEQYDLVFRVRTDLWLVTFPEVLTEPPTKLHIPTHDNWDVTGNGGLNDRFAFGPQSIMEQYLNRYARLDEFWQDRGVFHMETFLAWAMRDVPIARTRATFGIKRTNGDYTHAYRRFNFGDVPAPEVCV